MNIKQLIVNEDIDDEQHLYTILTDDNRIFVGGIYDSTWQWMEIPQPTPENTKWHGGQDRSPFWRNV